MEPEGVGRGTYYCLSGGPAVGGDVIEDAPGDLMTSPEQMPNISTDASEHLGASSVHLDAASVHLQTLEAVARHVREAGKVSQTIMIAAILRLCRDEFMPLRKMAQLLGRSPETLRVHYLNKLVRGGELELRYPNQTSHPSQAYHTVNTMESQE